MMGRTDASATQELPIRLVARAAKGEAGLRIRRVGSGFIDDKEKNEREIESEKERGGRLDILSG